MRKLLLFLILLSLSSYSANNASSNNIALYNLDDLKALSINSEYVEFFQHIYDIRPSQRNDEWKKLVSKNINDYLKQLIKSKEYKVSFLKTLIRLNKFDLINNDEILTLYSNDFSKGLLKQCQKKSHQELLNCFLAIYTFWSTTNKDKDLGVELAKAHSQLFKKISEFSNIIKEKINSISVWSLIRPAVESQLGDIYCSDDYIQEQLMQKLYQVHLQDKNEKLNFNYFSRKCLKSLKPRISKLLNSKNQLDRDLALNILNSTQTISNVELNLYHLTYLLDSPQKGVKFNNSWAKILEVSKDAQLRVKLIKGLGNKDFLPDELLNNPDTKLVETIYGLLERSFPEYIDFYYKHCLDFYSGARKFDRGNPTLNCLKFIRLGKRNGFLTQIQIENILKNLPAQTTL
jgi:hypothetical protein